MFERIPQEKRELIRAMVQAGKTYREIAEEMDVSVGVINKIMCESEDLLPLATEIRKRLAAKYVLMADIALDTISDAVLGWARPRERAVIAAIFTDKVLALEERGAREQDVNGEDARNTQEDKEKIPSGASGREHKKKGLADPFQQSNSRKGSSVAQQQNQITGAAGQQFIGRAGSADMCRNERKRALFSGWKKGSQRLPRLPTRGHQQEVQRIPAALKS
jgi:hypothetical protein